MVWGLLILRLDDLAKIVGRREGYVKNMAAATTKETPVQRNLMHKIDISYICLNMC